MATLQSLKNSKLRTTMNNACCALPVEVIATNNHQSGDQCCLITEKTIAPERAECPVSKTMSQKVQRRTLEHILRLEAVISIEKVQYYYCEDRICPVVYFSNAHTLYFTTKDVRVKVFTKDNGDDVNVCYCFEWTRGRINDEISRSGNSTAALEIAKEVKAGHCQCDIMNPKGKCCLGDVNAFVKASKTSNP